MKYNATLEKDERTISLREAAAKLGRIMTEKKRLANKARAINQWKRVRAGELPKPDHSGRKPKKK